MKPHPKTEFKISAASFYSFSKCPRSVYLDLFGESKKIRASSEFFQMLWRQGAKQEHLLLRNLKRYRPMVHVEEADNRKAFEKTLKLMEQGNSLIYKGVLIDGAKVGRPDFLEKVPGKSRWGQYYYVACNFRIGKFGEGNKRIKVKRQDAQRILFFSELLGKVQGVAPKIGKIIDGAGKEVVFHLDKHVKSYEETRDALNRIVSGQEIPEPVIGSICKECIWMTVCLEWAHQRQDPSLIFKLGTKKYELRETGIKDMKDVSEMSEETIGDLEKKFPDVRRKTWVQWRRRARVWREGIPCVYRKPKINPARREIYFDIEDDASQDQVYLHGFIEVENGRKKEYAPILVSRSFSEEAAAKKLWKYFESLSDDDVIYHYGNYENARLAHLADKYGLSAKTLAKFQRISVDLYQVVEGCSDWPVCFYGIKNIAKCLGFQWSSEDASGANSIAWYQAYRMDPENRKDLIEKILVYNREDCEAMIRIKDFLASATVRPEIN